MSLDIFGAVAQARDPATDHRRRLSEQCDRLNIGIAYDSLDENDCAAVDEGIRNFSKADFYYSIYSSRDGSDATELWNEARAVGMEVLTQEGVNPFVFDLSSLSRIHFPPHYFTAISESRLGNFINGLKLISVDDLVAITLVDGGIERTKIASPEECLSEILRSLVLPWDCSPNTLYIFLPK